LQNREVIDMNKNTISKTINGIEYKVTVDDPLSKDMLNKGQGSGGSIIDDIDRLYAEYEKMRMNEPTVLDRDDIYPRSYQWRNGNRYDMGKVAAVEEALKSWKKIEETEAYKKYIAMRSAKILPPDSWD
jgi:hypothetical protein